MNFLQCFICLLSFILAVSSRQVIFMFNTENSLRLPLQQQLQTLAAEMNPQPVHTIPHAELVRKQLFSRKFWKR